jgi:protein phosphatase
VVTDIDDSPGTGGAPTFVGSAAAPLSFENDTSRRPIRLPTLLLHPLKASQPEDSHFEPEREGYLEELIEEDRRRARRRRITWITGLVIVIALLVAGLVAAYNWTQTRFFVGADLDTVVVFQGVQQNLGPIPLSSVYEDTGIPLEDLSYFQRLAVEETISAGSLDEAREIVERLRPKVGR